MIDIHCHILPGLDDGARDLEESLHMASLAASEGITEIIATPHHANGAYDNDPSTITIEVEKLNSVLQERNIPLAVLPGQEIRLYQDIIDGVQRRECIALNQGQYILIELPSSYVPKNTANLIYELQVEGLRPIIAHPERNREIADDPDILFSLVQQGALSQVTAHSINGHFGAKVKKLSMDLCRRNLAHFVASDAHQPKVRPFGLREAMDVLASELGESARAQYLQNAECVARDIKLVALSPIEKKKKFFWFL
jgi:protein-tyrosine phosphatase